MTVQDDDSNGEGGEADEADDALGPWEPKMVNGSLKGNRVDYAAWMVTIVTLTSLTDTQTGKYWCY